MDLKDELHYPVISVQGGAVVFVLMRVDDAATKKLMAPQTRTGAGVTGTRWRYWADSRQGDYEHINFCLEKYYKISFVIFYRVDLLVLGDRSPRGGYRHPFGKNFAWQPI